MTTDDDGIGVTVPHLAESLVSVTIGKWLKSPGDYVKEYEVLCELETDKVNVEMPSPMEGTIVRIVVHEGESANVGAPICFIRGTDAESASLEQAAEPLPSENEQTELRARYSPAVVHLAEQHGVDLRRVKGTSLGGRINRKDVLAYIRNRNDTAPAPAQPVAARPPTREAVEPAIDLSRDRDTEYLPLTGARKVIADRMKQSVSEIPHAWLMIEADVTRLVALRERWKDRFKRKEGVRLTISPFVIKAVVNAIKDYPILNASWDSGRIAVKKDIHLCIAVGSEQAVVTPVIRNADRKTIAGLAIELNDLVDRARTGRLTLAELQGGTFTFNNTGAFGSILSLPIINHPQSAIITFESIVRKPVVLPPDLIAIRSMANVCLSLDHRILDGMVCGRFLQRVKHYLEQYEPDTAIY